MWFITIGIEITQEKDTIMISQKQYVQNILMHKGLEWVNPIAMPMDPNIQMEMREIDPICMLNYWVSYSF